MLGCVVRNGALFHIFIVFGSCFRTLADILVSDFLSYAKSSDALHHFAVFLLLLSGEALSCVTSPSVGCHCDVRAIRVDEEDREEGLDGGDKRQKGEGRVERD